MKKNILIGFLLFLLCCVVPVNAGTTNFTNLQVLSLKRTGEALITRTTSGSTAITAKVNSASSTSLSAMDFTVITYYSEQQVCEWVTAYVGGSAVSGYYNTGVIPSGSAGGQYFVEWRNHNWSLSNFTASGYYNYY